MGRSAEEQYRHDLKELTLEVDRFHELVHDGFKAPELTIEAIPELQARLWNAQLSYYALMHPRHER